MALTTGGKFVMIVYVWGHSDVRDGWKGSQDDDVESSLPPPLITIMTFVFAA